MEFYLKRNLSRILGIKRYKNHNTRPDYLAIKISFGIE